MIIIGLIFIIYEFFTTESKITKWIYGLLLLFILIIGVFYEPEPFDWSGGHKHNIGRRGR